MAGRAPQSKGAWSGGGTRRTGPDTAVLRPSFSTTVTGLRQAMCALKTGTEEIKRYLLDEASIIYECKTCHNMFRSLANLIAHKRSYCCHAYTKVEHIYKDKTGEDFAASQTIFIESEPVETVIPEEEWDIQDYSQSLETLKEASILQEIQEKPIVNRLLPPRKEGLASVINRLKNRIEAKSSVEAVVLEPIAENNNAFFQTVKEIKTISTEIRDNQQNSQLETAIIGPTGLCLPKDKIEQIIGRSASPSGSDNSKESEGVEERVRYSCPICKKDFCKIYSIYKHMEKQHGKSLTEAKQYRAKIKARKKIVSIIKDAKQGKLKKELVPEPAVGKITGKKSQQTQPAVINSKPAATANSNVKAGLDKSRPQADGVVKQSQQTAAVDAGHGSALPSTVSLVKNGKVFQVVNREIPRKLGSSLGLVSASGVGMQKVNRIHEVWETREDRARKEAKNQKSREERMQARATIQQQQRSEGTNKRSLSVDSMEGGEPASTGTARLASRTHSEEEDAEITFNMERISPTTQSAAKKPKTMQPDNSQSLSTKCKVCRKSFKTVTFLLQHYASTHYRANIQNDYRDAMTSGKCPICKTKFDIVMRLVVHLGATHKIVDNYVNDPNIVVTGQSGSSTPITNPGGKPRSAANNQNNNNMPASQKFAQRLLNGAAAESSGKMSSAQAASGVSANGKGGGGVGANNSSTRLTIDKVVVKKGPVEVASAKAPTVNGPAAAPAATPTPSSAVISTAAAISSTTSSRRQRSPAVTAASKVNGNTPLVNGASGGSSTPTVPDKKPAMKTALTVTTGAMPVHCVPPNIEDEFV